MVPWWGNTRTDFLADEPSHPMTPDADPRYNIDPTMPNWKVMRFPWVVPIMSSADRRH